MTSATTTTAVGSAPVGADGTAVLALQLAGPLQSWGVSARFARRTTEPAPTKSGVMGMLSAAVGVERDDEAGLARLARLRFGVRIDQAGTRVRDFQTARHFHTDDAMPLSERFYLADAVFVAAVEGDRATVTELREALRAPVYLPYLGRRSCPPARPVDFTPDRDIHTGTTLEDVLNGEPWHASEWHQRRHARHATVELRALVESPAVLPGDTDPTVPLGDSLRDQPLSFSSRHRRYGLRTITESGPIRVPNPWHRPQNGPGGAFDDHDPMIAMAGN
ncbi:type I-E CRISPR-associated protein Cas5/CasD [Streptomyces formicae]|uniref:Type I-E CRISPR-associated protein Cas5/CasD n=1 Tax=Streptomyces formicae TaxID=1616117 RepID=A0ABY3WQW8_9ACTN|nr:type I-E CRISPR-associated protein Cas5/CasD [Streptomyces formicae]UNM15017.1 type I-E CRISPR-associated protein Cas5/CasD [Streptomyces formicae]